MNLVLSLPYLADARLRALAVTSPQRSPIAPQLPTVAESGLAGFDMTTWYGLLVPGPTPRDIVARLQQHMARDRDPRKAVRCARPIGPIRAGRKRCR